MLPEHQCWNAADELPAFFNSGENSCKSWLDGLLLGQEACFRYPERGTKVKDTKRTLQQFYLG